MTSSGHQTGRPEILDDLQLHLSQTLDRFSIVAITNDQGVILYANENFCRISQYSRSELVGQTHRLINSGVHSSSFFKALWATILSNRTWTGDVCNRAKDGGLYWVNTQISPIDVKGRQYFIAVRNNITDKKKAEEENLRQEKQLLQADKMSSLGILTSGVAHEINNPNHLIMSNTELLERVWSELQYILEDKCREDGHFEIAGLSCRELKTLVPQMFDRIRGGAERIKNIVDGLKHFAREDQIEWFEEVNLNAIVEQALPLVESLIKNSTDRFQINLSTVDPIIKGRFQQIEQVFVNFITNACQALENPSQGITVTTQILSESQEVSLTVMDEGRGIAQEVMQKIMDPFFTTKHDTGGTGLGLFVSYGIVRRHGGEMQFKSSIGKGCCASIRFPMLRRES